MNEWNSYDTATKLQKYIDSIKPLLIGKEITDIRVKGLIYGMTYSLNGKHIYSNDCEDNELPEIVNPSQDVNMELDETISLIFGNTHIELDFTDWSDVLIGIDSTDYTDQSSIVNESWQHVGKYFKSNIIGYKLKDIVIVRTDKISPIAIPYKHKDGDDMYSDIRFIFESGYYLEITNDIDYMNVSEERI